MDQNVETTLVRVAEHLQNRFFGKYRGQVEDVADPENMGRLLVTVPDVYHDQTSPWAMPCVPLAGGGYGAFVMPEVGDTVWVEFEAGDISKPIWTGCFWAADEGPGGADAALQVRTLKTPSGHKLAFDDEAGEILLEHSGGALIKLTSSEIRLEIGGKSIAITSTGINMNSGAMEVK